MKYSDCLAEWLVHLGYSHCFYVGGGNIMHLVESLSRKLTCCPVINEVAAGIAAEYFNETSSNNKALVLVTAGPGLTNLVTAVAGAYAESRELLIIGGQVKVSDLSLGKVRQRGIQEIDGVSLLRSITIFATRIDAPVDYDVFCKWVKLSKSDRKGPVFIEMPLDVQAKQVAFDKGGLCAEPSLPVVTEPDLQRVADKVKNAKRPLLLIGGGIRRDVATQVLPLFSKANIPVATTWNGADRLPANHPSYVGRPNTWGQRSANLILQQSDLVIALGTRLGLQQTGFNWQQFVPNGHVIHVDVDTAELEKGHPRSEMKFAVDGNDFLLRLMRLSLGEHGAWLAYTKTVREKIPLIEDINRAKEGYLSPYVFAEKLSVLSQPNDVVIPCSSGSAFTVMMQVFQQKQGQLIVTNKGMASMGYGLSGAIGAAVANPDKRVILVEGDGGFAQNLQEIGTAAINQLNLKIFIFDDSGYASIRMTQRNYFGGRYVGCDRETGLGLPNWEKLFDAWDVPVLRITVGFESMTSFNTLFEMRGVAAFIVSVDPDQTYFPKITSKITSSGNIESNPLHLMTPDLECDLLEVVGKYLLK